MKELAKDKGALWPSTEQVEKSREELWNRIDREELECALRLPPVGYLIRAPLLEWVVPAVQVDLLADAWKRHQDMALHEASLFDAAVDWMELEPVSRGVDARRGLFRGRRIGELCLVVGRLECGAP